MGGILGLRVNPSYQILSVLALTTVRSISWGSIAIPGILQLALVHVAQGQAGRGQGDMTSSTVPFSQFSPKVGILHLITFEGQ